MAAPINVDESNFTSEINTDALVLVDFWAPWCGPCKQVAPVLDELAKDYDGKIKVVKVNVDENKTLAGQYGIRSIPSLLFFRGGQVVDSVIGAAPKARLAEKVEALSVAR
jgi:thioredoxin 1